jgi:cellulose synthase/poly-beta-1,6-N-acetylglucosamine synthase-like glycosyltransferase
MILLIPSIILLLVYSILIFYYRLVWNKIPVFIIPADAKPKTKISVIIPARNEENNIAACLDSLTEQDYPKDLLEIIVTDDHSTDKTAGIVSRYAGAGIILLELKKEMTDSPQTSGSKKAAITAAIKKSTGTLIITTDADCLFPKKWLSTLVSFYETYDPVFIAAPVKFSTEKKALHIFQSLDFLSLQGITAASVFDGFHTMCNGANLAYEKKAFETVGGFEGIDQIASGDDMLLMHKIYMLNPQRVMYCLSQDTIVETKPAENLKAFFNQRIRWASKALVYHDKRIFYVLMLVYLLNSLLLAFFIYSVLTTHLTWTLVMLILVKTIVELAFLIPVARFYKKTSLLYYFLPAQPFHILYTVIAGFLGQAGSYEWKGRKLK